MIYIIPIVVVVVCIVLYSRYSSKIAHEERIKKIQADWSHPKNEPLYFGRIETYSTLINESVFHQLSEQTIYDIDFHRLFGFIDRTSSKVGQQYLFDKLIRPSNNIEALNKLNSNVSFFGSNSKLREKMQHELLRLNTNDAYYISSLLQTKLLERPTWSKFLTINVLVTIFLLLLSIQYPVALILLLIPISVNMFIHYWNKSNMFQFIKSFPQLNLLINVSNKALKMDSFFSNKSVQESISALKPFQQKLGFVNLGQDGGMKDELSFLASYFIELLKGFFLIEVFTLFQLVKEVETKRTEIMNLFQFIGEIDAAISVASLREGNLKTCQPEFIPSAKKLNAKNMYHPLIENCVKNDISILSKGVLITGSNMSGKTTFLRTLVINSLLAQSICTCFADEFKTPIVKQFTSIRIDDSLFEGKSYYVEEVTVMASLIKEAESADQNIFVLDEVFKGTNTVERIASAKAVLSYLNRNNNLVVVSTHDIELSKMLEKEFELFHFVETIENNELHFDHKIKSGHLRTRNAIRILELFKYPKDIIDEAKNLSLKFEL